VQKRKRSTLSQINISSVTFFDLEV